jgi:uncharacterized membrane protein SpoIIM required for sporulation
MIFIVKSQFPEILFQAWMKLIRAYLIAFAASLSVGYGLIRWFYVPPEKLFELSTNRLAVAGAVFQKFMELGLDLGLVLFVWNFLGALATLSFIYTASWIDPRNIARFPHALRKSLVGKGRMKMLQFLPGCRKIEEEPVRRVYVWLMVPLLGIILLGAECGFIVSAAARLSGSFLIGILSLVPHGIIEIPAITLAGAVTFSGHLLVKEAVEKQLPKQHLADSVFDRIETYRTRLPVRTIALAVMLGLLVAGLIEAHITGKIMGYFAPTPV